MPEPAKDPVTRAAENRPETHDPNEPKSKQALPTLAIVVGAVVVVMIVLIVYFATSTMS